LCRDDRTAEYQLFGKSDFSLDGQVFTQNLSCLLSDWASWVKSMSEEPAEEINEVPTDDFEVDYSYMDRMADLARNAPGMRLTAEQAQVYAGLSDFSYPLYDDE